uniref:autotransporter outer membrane beta-barrel domain-containing protein n=1 Tax=Parasutterella excrementihominis TaxID=487175 RepID=UPI003FEFB25E
KPPKGDWEKLRILQSFPKIRMNEFDFKTRSLGTRFYFGVGGEYAFGNQWKAFAQIGGEHGNRLNVDFSCKAGIKYTF